MKPLFFSLINKWRRHNLSLDEDDMRQVLRIEMWRCWLKFDENRGVKFLTFCFPYLHSALTNHVWKTEHTVRIPWERFKEGKRLAIETEAFFHDTVAFDAAQNGVQNDYTTEEIADALQRLTPRWREVVELYFFQELTLQEIAQQWAISHQAVSKALKRALNALRKLFRKEAKA